MGLDEYETRSSHHHIAMCLLWSVPAEPAAGLGGKRCPGSREPQVYRVVREMLPREQFGPDQLLLWLEDTQLRTIRVAVLVLACGYHGHELPYWVGQTEDQV